MTTFVLGAITAIVIIAAWALWPERPSVWGSYWNAR